MIQLDYILSSRLQDNLVTVKSFHQDLNLLESHAVFIFEVVLDLQKFPPTSAFVTLHIKRAYLQAHLWYHCVFTKSVNIKPDNFGYLCNENEQLIPHIIIITIQNHHHFRIRAVFKMCTKKVCRCWKMSVKYCICGAGNDCQDLIDQ